MISAAQAREALVLLGWTPLTLAGRAFLALDDVTRALDDVAIRHLGGLQLGALREAFEAAGVAFSLESSGGSVMIRKFDPA
jgi:hypothetical protein